MKLAVLVLAFCIMFFVAFSDVSYSGTIDSATLSPANAAIQMGELQPMSFSATNNKTFAVKKYHAEFTYTKGLKISNLVTTPTASKATVSTSKNLITLEWSSVARGASVNATFTVSSGTAGTYSIVPKKISYIDNRRRTIAGACNSAQIVVQNDTTATVSGTVTDIATGIPLQDIAVSITDANQSIFSTATDATGFYEIANVTQGNFTASFGFAGYKSNTTTGTLASGQNLTLNVLLTPDSLQYEIIRPTDAYNPEGWINSVNGYEGNINTYAGKISVSARPSISFGGHVSNETTDAWQSKTQYWHSAWLYVTFEGLTAGSSDDQIEIQATDRMGNLKHIILPRTTGSEKMEFAQELQMSDWGDGFGNISDLRLRINGYITGIADSAEARVYDIRVEGDPSPLVRNYSRGTYNVLQGDDMDLSASYTSAEINAASAIDGNTIPQNVSAAASDYAVHLFKVMPSPQGAQVTWTGGIATAELTEAYAVSFKPKSSEVLTAAYVYANRRGNPHGHMRALLKSELGGEVLAESGPDYEIAITGPNATWMLFHFAGIQLSPGKTYFLEVWRDSLDTENYPVLYKMVCSDIKGYVRKSGVWSEFEPFMFETSTDTGPGTINTDSCQYAAYPYYTSLYGLDPISLNLQAYNRSRFEWELLDSKLYNGYTTDIDLSGTIAADEYLNADGLLAARIYASPEIAHPDVSLNLFTDSINFEPAGIMTVNPLSLDFGAVIWSGSVNASIQISNVGSGELLIGTLNVSDAPFAISSDNCSGTALLPSASCTVTVSFSPVTEGLFSGTLTIPSDDGTQPVITMNLQGTGIPQPASVSGAVTDAASGTPLQGVQITVSDSAGSHSATSDGSGTYTLTGLKAGNIVAIFRNPGYIDQTVNYTLISGQSLVLDVPLQHAPALTVIITTPQDGSVVTASPVVAIGAVTNEAAITVNGASITPAGGSFSASVSLVEGPNTITASATDQYGQTASHSIGVVFTPPKPPVISNVTAEAISVDFATITWITDNLSDSRVEYGQTPSYGGAAVDNQHATSHSIVLSGLGPDTTYHFRVVSTTPDGLSAASTDYIFTTLPFKAASIGDFGNITVMEVRGNYDAKKADGSINALPRQEIAKEFFKTHGDEYDFAIIVSNFDFAMPEASARAYYLGIKNDIQGIGNVLFDSSASFGSNGKLQGIIDMGNIYNHVADPLNPNFDTTLSLIAHEQMHRWGAYVKFIDANNAVSNALLGKDSTHWSYLLDSDSSLLYGNDWQDNGDGTFTSAEKTKYYSPLDLYLMGIYDKMQVPPMLLIDNSDIDSARMPDEGATISGTTSYITIDDIIAAEGERVPNAAASQKAFKTAFILITQPGTYTGSELPGIENIRSGWAGKFSQLTGGKGSIEDIPPAITIAAVSPLNDATVSGSDIMVKGEFFNTTGNETGITVNGITATVYSNQFIANHVPLTEGANTLNIIATDSAGTTATASVTVNATAAGDYIRITSNIESGISPLEVSLRVDGSFSVGDPDLSIAGPAPAEIVDNPAPDEFVVRFTVEGIYTITASVTGPDGNVYEDTITITVMNKTQLDKLLKKKWEGMKGALASQNIPQALNYYLEESKELYSDIYTAFYDQLPQLSTKMDDIQLIYAKNNTAKYRLREPELYGGNVESVTYYVYFVIGTDGLWKIYRY